jgi:uncharacterized membrane protein YgdD (TMEM256/DUF423 family)
MQAAISAPATSKAQPASSARTFIALGALFCALAVGLGAFGAHALKASLPADMLANFETGVRYHFYHALGLVLLGVLLDRWAAGSVARHAGWAFAAGIVTFSGSLYVMALTGARWLGAITPIGGAAFIAGWILIVIGAVRKQS